MCVIVNLLLSGFHLGFHCSIINYSIIHELCYLMKFSTVIFNSFRSQTCKSFLYIYSKVFIPLDQVMMFGKAQMKLDSFRVNMQELELNVL